MDSDSTEDQASRLRELADWQPANSGDRAALLAGADALDALAAMRSTERVAA